MRHLAKNGTRLSAEERTRLRADAQALLERVDSL